MHFVLFVRTEQEASLAAHYLKPEVRLLIAGHCWDQVQLFFISFSELIEIYLKNLSLSPHLFGDGGSTLDLSTVLSIHFSGTPTVLVEDRRKAGTLPVRRLLDGWKDVRAGHSQTQCHRVGDQYLPGLRKLTNPPCTFGIGPSPLPR
jgi:hypothetical protein